jgi:cell division septum initiation protein DivIVA
MDALTNDVIENYKSSLSRAFISSRLDHEKIEKLLDENKKLKKEIEVLKISLKNTVRIDIDNLVIENERLKGQVRMLKYVIDPMKDT